jgi:hypothetical protein
MEPGKLTVPELLQLNAWILGELRHRGIVRTKNLLGDYTEWLVAKTLNLRLSGNSTAGYDAVDDEGNRFQIKGRQPTPENPSTQLGALRSLDKQDFDFLIGVLYDPDFTPKLVVKVPHPVIAQYARFTERVNAHRLHLQGALLRDPRVEDITRLFDQA